MVPSWSLSPFDPAPAASQAVLDLPAAQASRATPSLPTLLQPPPPSGQTHVLSLAFAAHQAGLNVLQPPLRTALRRPRPAPPPVQPWLPQPPPLCSPDPDFRTQGRGCRRLRGVLGLCCAASAQRAPGTVPVVAGPSSLGWEPLSFCPSLSPRSQPGGVNRRCQGCCRLGWPSRAPRWGLPAGSAAPAVAPAPCLPPHACRAPLWLCLQGPECPEAPGPQSPGQADAAAEPAAGVRRPPRRCGHWELPAGHCL